MKQERFMNPIRRFLLQKMIGINPFEGLWANFTAGEQPEFRKLEQLAPAYRTESWRRGLLAVGVDDEVFAAKLAEKFARETCPSACLRRDI